MCLSWLGRIGRPTLGQSWSAVGVIGNIWSSVHRLAKSSVGDCSGVALVKKWLVDWCCDISDENTIAMLELSE